MIELWVIATVSFVKVAARAFQQKNVIHNKYLSVVPTSYLMAFTEIVVLSLSTMQIIEHGWLQSVPVALAYGTGAWTGCWLAMWLHDKLHRKEDDKKSV